MSIFATIEDWLLELPEPWRDKALANMLPDGADIPVESISEALLEAFRFEDTPEGADYWWQVIEEFTDEEVE